MMNTAGLFLGLFLLFSIALLIIFYPLTRRKISFLISTPLLFFIVACAYWRWGAWPDWKTYVDKQARQQEVQAMLKSVGGPNELIEKLKARLEVNPQSARGWYILGRLYSSQANWGEAQNAFTTAYRLEPNDEKIKVNYAQSIWQLNHQQFNKKIRKILQSVLSNNNLQPDALAMLAMDAFGQQAYQQAIDYWQRLLSIAPPQSEEANAIRKAIAKAQQKLS